MSVTGLNDATSGLSWWDMLEKMRATQEEGQGSEQFAAQLVSKKDADGDGVLSLEESGLEEEMFGDVDADGDGFLSAEELSADMQEKMEQMLQMMGSLVMSMQGSGMQGAGMQGAGGPPPPPPDGDPQEMAAKILSDKDSDGDSLLDLEESGLEEEMFGEIDADGDGFISAEEIASHMEAHAEEMASQGAAPPPPPPEGGQSQSSGSEEEYDEYDLNQDGVVTMDELYQAFAGGASGLSSLFGEDGLFGGLSSLTQRLAMAAYAAQDV